MARNGKIILCKDIKIDREYKNVLNYTETQMVELCQNVAHLVASANDYSFIRIDQNVIEVQIPYGTCLKANYIAMQNPNYSGKWFFAFIDKLEFRSPNATRITFSIDEFTTWFDYWSPKACFVVREHVSSDNLFEHQIDEGLPVGEYINHVKVQYYDTQSSHVVMATTVDPSNLRDVSGGTYGGVYCGANFYIFKNNQAINDAIDRMNSALKTDAIVGLFLLPDWLTGYNSASWDSNNIARISQESFVSQTLYFPYGNDDIDGYVPKNKKMFNSPYCHLVVGNNSGTSIEYNFEDFIPLNIEQEGESYQAIKFKMYGTCTPGGSIVIVPQDYKVHEKNPISSTTGDNFDYSFQFGKFPICSYNVDMYTNWLTQNAVNIPMQFVGATIQGATGNFVGMASQLAQTFDSTRLASLVPPSIHGNTNNGDIMYATKNLCVVGYVRTIKKDIAISIDNYLTKYGYKVNKIKIPAQTSRPHWNYVQIGQDDEIGYSNNAKQESVPAKAMENINNAYRRGLTIWHHHSELGDYSLDNRLQ